MYYYLLGLGSNIAPEENISAALNALNDIARIVDSSPAVYTKAVGDSFSQDFMNQLVVVAAELPEPLFKHRLRAIEILLGRAPKSPARRTLDRTIDIDILAYDTHPDLQPTFQQDESYYEALYYHWSGEEKV